MDDLLGTYVRLKNLSVLPLWAADHGVGISLYYEDPEQNRVEINASNYSDAWTATEHLRVSRGMMMAHVDPEKMIAARKAGVNNYIVKPFNAATLKIKMEAVFPEAAS